MLKRRQFVGALPLLGLSLAVSRLALGQPCCERGPTRILVGQAAGGVLDLVARYIATKLQDISRQPAIVENRVGAGGLIAAELVARASPDGYTLLMAYNSLFVQTPFLVSKLPIDPLKDLAPIAQVAVAPYVLALNPSIPASTAKEFASLARAQPNEYAFGSAGSGTSSHLAALSFNSVAQISARHIPFKGSGPAITQVMGGHVAYTFTGVADARELARSGRVKVLGITGDKRSSLMPETPTLKEAGLQIIDSSRWIGIFSPAGTPANEVKRISNTITTIITTPEAKERLVTLGLEVEPIDSIRLAAKMREESASWARIIKQQDIRVE